MIERLKYPLSSQAKTLASQLVTDWDASKINQIFRLVESRSSSGWTTFTSQSDNKSLPFQPERALLSELAQYHLIAMNLMRSEEHSDTWEILLLEELRNAVRNEFEVSDFFLTTAAVGTIVQGDLTIHPNANYQSAANVYGDNIQTIDQLSSELEAKLSHLLEDNHDLQIAITELRSSEEQDRIPKIGKVIMELGRCLQHGSNIAVILSALPMLIQFLHTLG
jgi:hypothetical protein